MPTQASRICARIGVRDRIRVRVRVRVRVADANQHDLYARMNSKWMCIVVCFSRQTDRQTDRQKQTG